MNERAYFFDAYRWQFEAQVVEQQPQANGMLVFLDRTFVYPSSGGQPCDSGVLAGQPIQDVFVTDDGRVAHLVAERVAESQVSAEIDGQRRFDHMQQHTGQHILSRAFDNLLQANTIGFHLGSESVTIDLDQRLPTAEQLAAVEAEANRIVWDNRPVTATFFSRAEIANLPLRKVPTVAGDSLRIVEIDGYDHNACGGTHVAHSGEVGQIKIVRADKYKQGSRISFLCGQRALHDYDHKNETLSKLSKQLTCGQDDLLHVIQRLQQELKQTKKALKQSEKRLYQLEAGALLAEAERLNGLPIIALRQADEALRPLATNLVKQGRCVALLAGDTMFVAAAHQTVDVDMARLCDRLKQRFGGKGGGSATIAQINGWSGVADELLNAAKQQLTTQFSAEIHST